VVLRFLASFWIGYCMVLVRARSDEEDLLSQRRWGTNRHSALRQSVYDRK